MVNFAIDIACLERILALRFDNVLSPNPQRK